MEPGIILLKTLIILQIILITILVNRIEKMKTTCISCSKQIPEERLEILPGTQYCVECANKKVKPKNADILPASETCRNGFSKND